MTTPYDDIIGLPHHVSETRPRMSARDRAAQFSPFAALTGFGSAITETARRTGEKLELDDCEKEALNRRLGMIQESLSDQPTVSITYFVPDGRKAGGEYVTVSEAVRKIDSSSRLVAMRDGTAIPIDEIIRIEGDLFQTPDTL